MRGEFQGPNYLAGVGSCEQVVWDKDALEYRSPQSTSRLLDTDSQIENSRSGVEAREKQ
jgi:hypothetical protein